MDALVCSLWISKLWFIYLFDNKKKKMNSISKNMIFQTNENICNIEFLKYRSAQRLKQLSLTPMNLNIKKLSKIFVRRPSVIYNNSFIHLRILKTSNYCYIISYIKKINHKTGYDYLKTSSYKTTKLILKFIINF